MRTTYRAIVDAVASQVPGEPSAHDRMLKTKNVPAGKYMDFRRMSKALHDAHKDFADARQEIQKGFAEEQPTECPHCQKEIEGWGGLRIPPTKVSEAEDKIKDLLDSELTLAEETVLLPQKLFPTMDLVVFLDPFFRVEGDDYGDEASEEEEKADAE